MAAILPFKLRISIANVFDLFRILTQGSNKSSSLVSSFSSAIQNSLFTDPRLVQIADGHNHRLQYRDQPENN
jgi:hypothetical protein